MNILITGGTGFLGGYLIKELAQKFDNIYVLSRQGSPASAGEIKNLKYVKGDITNLDILIMDESEKESFLESIDVFVHAAALYDLSASYSACFIQNVVGTQNVIHLINRMKNLKSFYYISTIAVGDQNSFFLDENTLPKRQKFNDAYSETKYLAEQLVRENTETPRHYQTRIIRPGIIIGDSVTRDMPKIDGPYYFIEAFKKYGHLLKLTPVIPLSFNPRAKLPIIPVDHCARFISLLIKRDEGKNPLKTYHLVSSELPTLSEFLADLNDMFKLKTHYLAVPENKLHNTLLKLTGIPEEVLPFMFSKLSYDKTSTLEDLPEISESTYSAFKHILFGK